MVRGWGTRFAARLAAAAVVTAMTSTIRPVIAKAVRAPGITALRTRTWRRTPGIVAMISTAMTSTASGIVMASTTGLWLSLAAPTATSGGAHNHQYQTGT